jgi:hypothetical protein
MASLLGTKWHQHDGKLTVERVQNCTAIAEHTKRLHNEGYHGSSDMKHAASIPLVIIEKYCNEQGVSFEEFMGDETHIKRVVEHPDNAMFRVWKGRL